MSVEPKQQREEFGVATGPDSLRLERVLPGPVERVWAYLTESEKRGKWLASGPMELRVGGHVELTFLHADLSSEKTAPEEYRQIECGHKQPGTITQCDPPRLLAYTWGGGSEVMFELTPQGNDSLLVITHRKLSGRAATVDTLGGWDAHTGILSDQLNGVEPRPFWTTFLERKAEYDKRVEI
jgi:uncharacterized protein YndB with AHSA1/START domain